MEKINYFLYYLSFLLCFVITLYCSEDNNSRIDIIIYDPIRYGAIQNLINNSNNNNIIILPPAIYNESITIIDKNITIASFFYLKNERKYIKETIINSINDIAITIGESDDLGIKIIGLTIKNGKEDGISCSSKIELRDSIIVNCGDGIDYENGSGGLCLNNIFKDNTDDGIDLDGAVDIIIENNMITDNGDDGIEVRLHKYQGNVLEYRIKNNYIYNNFEDGIQLIDYPDLSSRIFIINNNIISFNKMSGIGCMGDGDTIENFEGASIKERVIVHNNTFVNNKYGITGGDNLIFVNNIVTNSSEDATKNLTNKSIISYCLLYNNKNNFNNCIVNSNNIILLDPLLNDNYELNDNSPCIDSGIAEFIWDSEIIFNIPQYLFSGENPDIGAKEYYYNYSFKNTGNNLECISKPL